MAQSWWQLDWIWTTTGYLLAAIGATLLLWSLFWDRARGRLRCPNCWYDMSGARPPTCQSDLAPPCPECGRKCRKPQELSRTRRRWRVAATALGMCVLASQFACLPQRAREKWPTRFFPSTVLALATPIWIGSPDSNLMEVARARRYSMWEWQTLIIAELEMRTHPIDLATAVSARHIWRNGEPIRVHLMTWDLPESSFVSRNFEMTCDEIPDEVARAYTHPPDVFICGMGYDPSREFVTLSVVPMDTKTLHCRVRCTYSTGSLNVPLAIKTVLFPIQIVGRSEQVLESVDSPEIGNWIRGQTTIHSLTTDAGRETVVFCAGRRNDGISARVKMELRRDGQTIGESRRPFSYDTTGWVFRGRSRAETDEIDRLWDGKLSSPDLDRWTLHIVGDHEAAEEDPDISKFWSGELNIPIREVTGAPQR